MEKILTILQDAETTSHDGQVQESSKYSQSTKLLSFTERFFNSLGNDVFEYKVYQVLNSLEVVNRYDVFQRVSPETTKNIFSQYLTIFKDRYIWKLDSDPDAMEKLGRLFGENPRLTMASLSAKLNKLSSSLLVDGFDLRTKDNFKFDFLDINFYQPFKHATEDPLVLRKGLSMKQHPLNLLVTMVNDENVLNTFLKRSRSSISPLKLQNFMVAQSLEGSQAFKIIVKRYLRNSDPERTIHSPFEGYHLGSSKSETDSDIEIVKAIVASRSRLVDRLLSYRDYKFGLLRMDESKQDTNEKVVKILANIFDRFFGVCYRMDAKYCNGWVENLIEFYLQNDKNEKLFEQLFKDSILNFRQAYVGLKFDKLQFHWDKRDEKSKTSPKKSFKKWQNVKSKDFIEDVRNVLADSKLSHEKASG